MFPEAHFRKQS